MLLSLSMVGVSKVYVTGLHSGEVARSFGIINQDVGAIVSDIHGTKYGTLLNSFSVSFSQIEDGQRVTYASNNSSSTKASYLTELIAIKEFGGSVPEALRVRITATQQRVKLGDATHIFETVVRGSS